LHTQQNPLSNWTAKQLTSSQKNARINPNIEDSKIRTLKEETSANKFSKE